MIKIFVGLRYVINYINRSRRMPVLLRNIFLLMVVFSIAMVIPKRTNAQLNVSFQVFYDELSPYGSWMNNADYGYVWRPSNRNNFFPYGNNGYWLYTEMGWSWVSTYRWGWAPFHYGRWFYDSYYGWVWVPGYEWSPAWVAWREAPGYYGWAPLSPGISIDIAFGNNYNLPYDRWRFVNQRDIGRRDIDKHFAGLGGYLKYLEQSRSINNVRQDQSRNISYHAGPQINEVEKVTGQHFNPVKIKSIQTPKQNVTKNELQIFKPSIKSNTKENIKPKKIEVWNKKAPKSVEQQKKPNQEKPIQQTREIRQQPAEKTQPKKEQPAQNKPIQQPREIRQQPAEKIQPKKEQPAQNKPIQQPKEIRQQPVEKIQPRKEQPEQNKPIQQPKEIRQQPAEKIPPRKEQPVQNKPIQQPKEIRQQPSEKIQPKKVQPIQNKPVQQPKVIREKPLDKKPPQQ